MDSLRKIRSPKTKETGKGEPIVKKNYAEKLTSALDWLRAWKEICDLTIKVGNESFPVHRPVVAAASNYFYELIKNDSNFMRDDVLQLKDVNARAVRQCIEFMYNGKASVTAETVFDILLASEKFKLDDLVELCLEFLSENISIENCFRSKKAFQSSGLSKKVQEVDVFIARKFELLIGTDEFLNLNEKHLRFYITTSESDAGLLWQAVRNWVTFDIAKRKQHYHELVSCIKNSLDVRFVLDTVWPDPLTAQSKQAKDTMGVSILEDVTTLKECLTTDNCFHANEICEITKHGNSGNAQSLVRLFIAENFDNLCLMEGFLALGKDALLEILRSSQAERVSEKLKWNVVRKWIHHDISRRKQFFPALLSLIKLENLELDFLQSVVRADETVQEFDECKDMIMDAFYAIANPGGAKPSTPKSGKAGKTPKTPRTASRRSIAVVSQPSPSRASRKRPSNTEDTPTKLKRPRQIPDSPVADMESTETQTEAGKPHLAVYDPGTGKLKGLDIEKVNWNDLASTKVMKGAFQGVVINRNILYLLKGVDLFSLDVAKKSWTKLTSKQKQPATWSKLLAWQNGIYVLQNGSLDEYSIENDAWVEKKPFASHGVGFSLCLLQSNVYVMGGLAVPTAANIYNLNAESVIEIASMTIGRSHAAATALKGKVYVLGGSNDGALSSTECYDPTTDVWTTAPPMQKERFKFCACVYDGKIYAVGGKSPQSGTLDTVEVYERAKDRYKWRMFHQLIRASEFASACVLNVPCE